MFSCLFPKKSAKKKPKIEAEEIKHQSIKHYLVLKSSSSEGEIQASTDQKIPQPILINSKDVFIYRKLESGTFGKVYYGTWNNIDVAIKKIPDKDNYLKEKNNLNAVAYFLNKTPCEHIVRFHGCIEEGQTHSLLTDYISRGDLIDVMSKNASIPLHLMLQIAHDIINGIKWLHAHYIIHCDIKPENVLIDDNMHAKITDFGLSVITKASATYVRERLVGTHNYLAPELLIDSSYVYSFATDIYAYAITLWSIIHQTTAYSEMSSNTVTLKVLADERPAITAKDPKGIAKLINMCWMSAPEKRLNAEQAAVQVEQLKSYDTNRLM